MLRPRPPEAEVVEYSACRRGSAVKRAVRPRSTVLVEDENEDDDDDCNWFRYWVRRGSTALRR